MYGCADVGQTLHDMVQWCCPTDAMRIVRAATFAFWFDLVRFNFHPISRIRLVKIIQHIS